MGQHQELHVLTDNNGHEFEQTPGDSEGQGSMVCCSPWGPKELDTTVTEQQQTTKSGVFSSQSTYILGWNISSHLEIFLLPENARKCKKCKNRPKVEWKVLSLYLFASSCSMWDPVPQPGIKPTPSTSEAQRIISTTGPPGKSLHHIIEQIILSLFSSFMI